MAENIGKVQINFQVSPEDAIAIDELARQDGYDKRASWIRRVVRAEVDRRFNAIGTALPYSTGLQASPVSNLHPTE